MEPEPFISERRACSPVLATTHWSVVLAAREPGDSAASPALESLCRTYWYPVYAYIRRRGNDAVNAEDLTQEFFLHLLDKNYLSQVDPQKGRFRSFLLVAINQLLSNERDRQRAAKRGGRLKFVSLDELRSEERYRDEPITETSPEKLFELRWAMAILERVLEGLRREFIAEGKGALFDELKLHLIRSKEAPSYASQAKRLGSTEAALKMAAMRMRHRFGELLREEIAKTVASMDEIDDELRYLFAVLSRS